MVVPGQVRGGRLWQRVLGCAGVGIHVRRDWGVGRGGTERGDDGHDWLANNDRHERYITGQQPITKLAQPIALPEWTYGGSL